MESLYLSTFITLEDKTNGLLKRREVKCSFKGSAGRLTRKEAVEILTKELKLDEKFVIPANLICKNGVNDIHGTFYIYDDENLAKKHLPKYIIMRMLTKEERKKVKEAEKAKSKGSSGDISAKVEEAPKEVAKVEEAPKEVAKVETEIEKLENKTEVDDKPEVETKE